jgi:hypothetical protein
MPNRSMEDQGRPTSADKVRRRPWRIRGAMSSHAMQMAGIKRRQFEVTLHGTIETFRTARLSALRPRNRHSARRSSASLYLQGRGMLEIDVASHVA